MRPRGLLFRKYVVLFVALVGGALITSGLVEIYFTYQESKTALVRVQREKAAVAASRIEQFVTEVERQLQWITQSGAGAVPLEQRRFDALRLLRHAPTITEVSHLDAAGREQLRVSRLAMDVIGSQADLSREPKFLEARARKVYFSPVYFRKESEPYMTVALAGSGDDAGVTVAEVNLKFIWDVVSQIKIGKAGRAYVVDSRGNLIAHPDISLVLQKTDLSSLPYFRAAATAKAPGGEAETATIARDLQGHQVLTAYAPIAPLGWLVFVDLPLGEAFAPLYASMLRTGALLLVGLALSVAASLVLARRMVTPIQAVQAGAARIGAGALEQRIEVRTGDELEALAEEFNRMASRLRDSYGRLEQKVAERTRELSEALERQMATGEVLRILSSSPTDLQPVFDTILANATRLCGAQLGALHLYEDGAFVVVALAGATRGFADFLRQRPLRPGPGTGLGRLLQDGRPVHIPDLKAEPAYAAGDPLRVVSVDVEGARTLLAVPMLKDQALVGTITIYRREVRPFGDKQIELLKTFADQAVIAIENVRLFQELQARTQELARSVEELRALGEVGQAVSSTLDLQNVLATVAAHAVRLSGTDAGAIYEFDEASREFHLRATHQMSGELIEAIREARIRLGETGVGQAAVRRAPVQIPDILDVPSYPLRDVLARAGFRAVLAVPIFREDAIIGGLVVRRRAPGTFPKEILDLLETFASQSALAIQNARLFREVDDKSRQLEVANRHKSEFLANMSHELRTPLNAVIGFSEVLLERMFGGLNDKQAEYLQDILDSGRHLLSLINDILDLSKVEAGRMELELAPFDLPLALDNALTLVRERAARHGIALDLAVADGLGPVVADERKVKQVLLNLLSNAVKFTPEGGRVTLAAKRADGGIQISVADTGVGIAPEDQEAIFEEFRQVGTDAARKREGTGLGLTLTRKLVELHGGRIRVESEVGKGSTFTVSLPVRS
ncbi:MAG: GAF domain-containing protein [Candidatus Rokubacteria bacterium]|nr:GAF domain-containing protein [Candidatus Rokubacteria bacterium]